MSPHNLLSVVQKPFEPFRIHVSDGTKYDVHHPELVMPGLTVAIIGIPADPSQPIFEKTEHLALNHIVRLEPLSQKTTAADGKG